MMIPQIYDISPRSVIFCNSASSAVLPPATLWLNFNAWPLTRLAPCCLRNTLGADGLHLKGIFGWGVARLWSPAGCSVAMLREGWISWTAAEWVPSAAQSEPPPLSRLYVELGVLLRYSTEGDQPAAQPGPAGGRELDRVDQLPVEEVCKKLQFVKKRPRRARQEVSERKASPDFSLFTLDRQNCCIWPHSVIRCLFFRFLSLTFERHDTTRSIRVAYVHSPPSPLMQLHDTHQVVSYGGWF